MRGPSVPGPFPLGAAGHAPAGSAKPAPQGQRTARRVHTCCSFATAVPLCVVPALTGPAQPCSAKPTQPTHLLQRRHRRCALLSHRVLKPEQPHLALLPLCGAAAVAARCACCACWLHDQH